jgi:acetolactate synthase I/II/III large subunit
MNIMSPTIMTCGTHLAHLLDAYGVRHVFGIPGVHNVEVYRGLPQTRIRHVSPRHEQGAGFMADGYARSTGKPGVAFVITGPGLTNIATAMGQAYADSVPMLVIAAVNKRHQLGLGRGYLHEMPNQANLASGLSAFTHTLLRARELPDVLAAAWSVFTSSRPRPVVINIPIDVMEEMVEVELPIGARRVLAAPGPDPEAIQAAATLLNSAKRVMLIAGGGSQEAGRQITDLAERLGAVVLLTQNARGLMPPDHPQLADFGIARDEGRAFAAEADVVIAIGTEMGETDFNFYSARPFEVGGKFIRIDIDPRQIAVGQPPDVGIVSDARLACSALLERLPLARGRLLDMSWTHSAVAGLSSAAAVGRGEPLDPLYHRFLHVIRDASPGLILVGDSTKPAYRGLFTYRAPQPRSYFAAGTGYGTLGYALPAAIGAKVAMPDRPVIALAGDGGAQFTFAELLSARQSEAGVVLVIWNNGGYGDIRDYMVSQEIAPIAVDPIPPDFVKSAEAMGVAAKRVETLDQLSAALRGHDRSAKTPLLLEAGPWIKG